MMPIGSDSCGGWSSYRGYIDGTKASELVDQGPIAKVRRTSMDNAASRRALGQIDRQVLNLS